MKVKLLKIIFLFFVVLINELLFLLHFIDDLSFGGELDSSILFFFQCKLFIVNTSGVYVLIGFIIIKLVPSHGGLGLESRLLEEIFVEISFFSVFLLEEPIDLADKRMLDDIAVFV